MVDWVVQRTVGAVPGKLCADELEALGWNFWALLSDHRSEIGGNNEVVVTDTRAISNNRGYISAEWYLPEAEQAWISPRKQHGRERERVYNKQSELFIRSCFYFQSPKKKKKTELNDSPKKSSQSRTSPNKQTMQTN